MPGAVLVVVVTVKVEEPEPVTEAGLKEPLAPEGRPLTLKETLLLKPFCALTVAV